MKNLGLQSTWFQNQKKLYRTGVKILKNIAIESDLELRKMSLMLRLLIIIILVLLHSGLYYAANSINSERPPSVFIDFTTSLDNSIPFIAWTWFIYYLGDIFITIGAAIIVMKLPDNLFRRAVYVYTGMIIAGALLQIIFPAKAPWPDNLAKFQHFMHNLISMRPYACLPSMHVALTILPTCILYSVIKSFWIRSFVTLFAALVMISTLTLKEHFFLDALTGIILALIFYGFWRMNFRKLSNNN
jgi:hypothetical protein